MKQKFNLFKWIGGNWIFLLLMAGMLVLGFFVLGLEKVSIIFGYSIFFSTLLHFLKKARDETKHKFVKIFQLIGFGILFLSTILTLIKKELLGVYYLYVILASFSLVLLSIFLRMRIKKKKSGKNLSLEDKVKNDLQINSTTKKVSFPKAFSWVGGFVNPAIPFVSVVNKNWKKRLNKEAIIHENVHLYYLQNGLLFGYMFIGIVLLFLFTLIFGQVFLDNFVVPLSLVLALSFMIFFEWITFRKTNQIGDRMRIKTRKWNKGIFFKYLIVYTIQLSIVYGLYYLIKWIIHLI